MRDHFRYIRSSTDSGGAKTPRNPVLLPYLYIIIPRPVSYFHINFNNSGTVDKYITYISRVQEVTRLLSKTIKHSISIVLYMLV